jgi:hypothetical protein
MVDMSNANMENVVPLFMTFEDLQSTEQTIWAEFCAEWDSAYKHYDEVIASLPACPPNPVIKFRKPKDADLSKALAQATTPAERREILAKALHEAKIATDHLTKQVEFNSAKHEALNTLIASLKAAVSKRNERLYGTTAVAKRSLRFATARNRGNNYGPGGGSLPPAAS